MQAFLIAANLISLGTYLMNDMLRIRLLSVVATSCLVVYFGTRPEPMLAVVCWNLVFLLMNLVQIVRLLGARRAAPGAVAA